MTVKCLTRLPPVKRQVLGQRNISTFNFNPSIAGSLAKASLLAPVGFLQESQAACYFKSWTDDNRLHIKQPRPRLIVFAVQSLFYSNHEA